MSGLSAVYLIILLSTLGSILGFRAEAKAVHYKESKKRFPNAIIIGVKKSGTRALLEFLKINPMVKAPGPEVHFFDKHYHLGYDWYRDQMPETFEHEITIEKSPAYYINKSVPGRVYEMNPKIKLIVVVRNPLTRAISDYTQAVTRKKRSIFTSKFEELVTCFNESSPSCHRGINASWGAVRIGIYHRPLHYWLQYFPLNQFLFIDGEKLITDPASQVRQAEKFLGIPPVVKKNNFVYDPVKKFPCIKRTVGTVHCLGKSKGRIHPQVRPMILQKLADFYRPENEKFFKLIKRRFDWF